MQSSIQTWVYLHRLRRAPSFVHSQVQIPHTTCFFCSLITKNYSAICSMQKVLDNKQVDITIFSPRKYHDLPIEFRSNDLCCPSALLHFILICISVDFALYIRVLPKRTYPLLAYCRKIRIDRKQFSQFQFHKIDMVFNGQYTQQTRMSDICSVVLSMNKKILG